MRITNEITEMVDGKPVPHARQSDVYLREVNKLHVYTTYDNVRKGFWYNGKTFAIFRFDNSTYDITPAPPTTIAMIDSLHHTYGIDFPAADIFYPTLTDDIIALFDTVMYLGTHELNGSMCKAINAWNKELELVFYIDKVTHMPAQMALYGRGSKAGEVFIATYQHWQLNPLLGDEIFEFSPPKNASKAELFKQYKAE